MALIIGIDPGLHHTGWGIIDSIHNRLTYVASGTISTSPKDTVPKRLATLNDGLESILHQFNPCEAAIEETFVNSNATTSLKLGHARGALILTLTLAGLSVSEYAATLIKKSVVGVGRADKDQIAMMVKHLLPHSSCNSADAADALAVAICHTHISTTKHLVESHT